MNDIEFGHLVNDIFSYFQRRTPPERTMELWHDKCRTIPAEAREAIVKALSDMEELPKNIPGSIHSAFQQWLRQNPDKRSSIEYHSCRNPNCFDGILMLRRSAEIYGGQFAEYSANCGDCHQRQNEPRILILSMRRARELGYEPADPPRGSADPGRAQEYIKKIWPEHCPF